MGTKILHLSDLHLDVNKQIKGYDLTNSLIAFLLKKDFDILLISGDVMGEMYKTLEVIDYIEEELGKKVLFVPGNHDIWVEKPETSWESLEMYMKHRSNLINNPYLIDDWAIVGGFTWYDFTFKIDSADDEAVYENKAYLWNDSRYALWGGMKDKEVFEKMIVKLKNDLDTVKDKKVWVMNHFIPYRNYLTYKNDWKWNFSNAFMGSEKIGELFDTYNNIEVISFGHTHRRFDIDKYNDKIVVCRPLGYVGEWTTDNIMEELEESSFIFELS